MTEKQSLRADAGFTLVELLVTVGLSGAVFLGIGSLMVMTSGYQISSEAIMARDALLSQLMTAASNPTALTRSLYQYSSNAGMVACICGVAGQTCDAAQSDIAPYDPFNLYAPAQASAVYGSLMPGETPISGGGTPVYYDLRGTQVTAASGIPSNAVFEAYSSVRFQCIPPLPDTTYVPHPQCNVGDKAELMQVLIVVDSVNPNQPTVTQVKATRAVDLTVLYPPGATCP